MRLQELKILTRVWVMETNYNMVLKIGTRKGTSLGIIEIKCFFYAIKHWIYI